MAIPPTEGSIQTQAGLAMKIFNDMRLYAGVNAANFIDDANTLKLALETDFSFSVESALTSTRSGLAGVYESGGNVIFPFFVEYAKTILAENDVSLEQLFKTLRRHFDDNTLSVNSREFTFGSPAAGGSNVGDGALNRLTTDRYDFDLENQTPDSKKARCESDASLGEDAGQEIFKLEGGTPNIDRLVIGGSGLVEDGLTGLTGRDSSEFVSNPSFSDFTGDTAAAPDSITDWTPTVDIANFEIDTTEFYRTFSGEGTPSSVKFETNDKLTQVLDDSVFDEDTPTYLQVAYNGTVGSADGTLEVVFGGVTFSVALTGAGGWKLLKIPLDKSCWYEEFNTTDLSLSIERKLSTTGYLLVDDVILAEMTPFDGAWYALVGGAIPFLFGDTFTFSDTAVDAAIIQLFLWIYFGEYLLPNKLGTETWSDP